MLNADSIFFFLNGVSQPSDGLVIISLTSHFHDVFWGGGIAWAYIVATFAMGISSLYYFNEPSAWKIPKSAILPLAYFVIFQSIIAYFLMVSGCVTLIYLFA